MLSICQKKGVELKLSELQLYLLSLYDENSIETKDREPTVPPRFERASRHFEHENLL